MGPLLLGNVAAVSLIGGLVLLILVVFILLVDVDELVEFEIVTVLCVEVVNLELDFSALELTILEILNFELEALELIEVVSVELELIEAEVIELESIEAEMVFNDEVAVADEFSSDFVLF